MSGRVLIVDDDSWQAEHLLVQLDEAGYEVTITAHASQALDGIDVELPECIVLDIGLPGANGMALIHEIRSHADTAEIPVIVCTNVSVDLGELRPYGVVEVIQKSNLDYGDIVAAVRKALS